MKKIFIILLFLLAIITNVMAQKEEINKSEHFSVKAQSFAVYRSSSGYDRDSLPNGSILHIQTFYDTLPHQVKYWISSIDGTISHSHLWQGDIYVMKNTIVKDNGKRLDAFGIRWNGNPVFSAISQEGKPFDVVFDEDESNKATASKSINMARNFSINGNLRYLFLTPERSMAGTQQYEDGWLWHLENSMIGDECYAKFYIIAPDGSKQHFTYWNGGVRIDAMKSGGEMMYFIEDDDFIHLMILGEIVQLCAVPK